MITDSFDNKSLAKINPTPKDKREKCDVCIITFSYVLKDYILNNFKCKQIGETIHVAGNEQVYYFKHKNKKIAFYKTWLGAPASVGMFEDVSRILDCNHFIIFGAAGSLNKEISYGKIMVPTYAYRDEGTSYHYIKPQDYIKVKNAGIVAKFLKDNNIPYVKGKTWTTDSFYRETENNINKRKNEGCISVEMECSAMQAVCDFRGFNLYYFLLGGDLLDAPKWVNRKENENVPCSHRPENFYIALKLAETL
ncbi:MAG: nucleoside phosphorylase [Clostridia bacterium]|nr:nucleoside phosphorylase [Clostridia bacterium]